MMEDFYYAGGLPAMMNEITDLLHLDAMTASGKTVRENIARATVINREVIAGRDRPHRADGGLVVLRGNICPNGAILKQAAATDRLLQHEGRAIVFEDFEELHRLVDDPDLENDEKSVMGLKNAGPKSAPGMPGRGHLPNPEKR